MIRLKAPPIKLDSPCAQRAVRCPAQRGGRYVGGKVGGKCKWGGGCWSGTRTAHVRQAGKQGAQNSTGHWVRTGCSTGRHGKIGGRSAAVFVKLTSSAKAPVSVRTTTITAIQTPGTKTNATFNNCRSGDAAGAFVDDGLPASSQTFEVGQRKMVCRRG